VKGKRKEEQACYCEKGKRKAHEHYRWSYPELVQHEWSSICIDEAHRGVVRNHKSLTARSLTNLKVNGKPCLMSGTPMKKLGGADIWGMLHFIDPNTFSSYWRFVDSFFEVTDNGFGKKVGKLIPEREEAMYRMLTPYLLRRTKRECAPWLPDKLYVDVDVRMSQRQAQQYQAMHEEAVAAIGRGEVVAKGVLDRIVRLKQFANAHCKIDSETGAITPIASPKVDAMLEKMEEIGMFDDASDRKQLVFSQSRKMVEYTAERIAKRGLPVAVISGRTRNRRELVDAFQGSDLYRVMCIVTTAGGVSLTLDAADEVHLIDEMWSPDDDEQAEDRAHRVSRIHQVTVFIYRSIDTVDQDIALAKLEKADSHERILDVRRRLMERHYT
jgi:SNF2 family DNA or RNA helicase